MKQTQENMCKGKCDWSYLTGTISTSFWHGQTQTSDRWGPPFTLPCAFQLERILSERECTTPLGPPFPRAKPHTSLGSHSILFMELSCFQTCLFLQSTKQKPTKRLGKEELTKTGCLKTQRWLSISLSRGESACCSHGYICSFSIQQKIPPQDEVKAPEWRQGAVRP